MIAKKRGGKFFASNNLREREIFLPFPRLIYLRERNATQRIQNERNTQRSLKLEPPFFPPTSNLVTLPLINAPMITEASSDANTPSANPTPPPTPPTANLEIESSVNSPSTSLDSTSWEHVQKLCDQLLSCSKVNGEIYRVRTPSISCL